MRNLYQSMTSFPYSFLIFIFIITGCSSLDVKPDLVIHNVNVIDVEKGEILENQALFIVGKRIHKIENLNDVIIQDSVEHLNGNGGYLIPGLWDSHVHVVTERRWSMPLMLAYGITGVRNMHTTEEDPLGKIAMVKKELTNNEYPGPRFIANGPIVDGIAEGVWPQSVIVGTEKEARAAVDSLADGGADFIKTYDSLEPDVFMAILDQASKRNIPVDGHVPALVDPLHAARAGMRTSEHAIGITQGCTDEFDLDEAMKGDSKHLDEVPGPLAFARMVNAFAMAHNPEKCESFLKEYAKTDIVVTPHIIGQAKDVKAKEMVTSAEAMKYLPLGYRNFYRGAALSPMGEEISSLNEPVVERALQSTKDAHDAGIMLLAGTDLGNPFLIPGYSLHEELRLLHEAGLSPVEVLRTATLNPAITFGFSDSLGLIKQNFLADLVLLKSNPLEDISAVSEIDAVIRNGKLYTRDDLDTILKEIEEAHKE